jgi:signal transduction histidine kinase
MSQAPDDLNFSIDSRLLEELGENLVTRNHVAVAELIKNAYDADATQVELEFINARQENEDQPSEIRIKDDGVGMTYEEIDENWMRIGTTDKIRNPRTEKYGREKTGNKGIGRFSCRRLGYRLELTSTAKDPNQDRYVRTYVEFPWEEFARDTDVDNIGVDAEVEYLDEGDTGVTLRIMDLRDEWTQRDFNTLRRNSLTLSVAQPQRREGFEEDPGFDIMLDAPEFEQGEGSLLDQVYDAGWCELQGEFADNGDLHLTIEAKKIGKRTHILKKEYHGLEGTNFKMAFIPKKKEYFRDRNTLSLQRAKDITENYGGIRVYKDGFRVYPYGGLSNDWLGLDRYHTRRLGSPDDELRDLSGKMEFHREFNKTMHLHPRNENLIGRVNVSNNANLEMKANREGFIQNHTYEDMREGLRLSLQWLTLQYSNYQAIKEKEEFREEAEDFANKIDSNRNESDKSEANAGSSENSSSGLSKFKTGGSAGTSGGTSSTKSTTAKISSTTSSSTTTTTTDTETVDQAVSVIQKASETVTQENQDDEQISEVVEAASEIVQQSVEKNRKEIDFYRSAFSVNQFIFSFMHELRDMILELETKKSDLNSTADSLPSPENEQVRGIANDIDELKSRFEQQMNLFGVLTDSTDEVGPDTHRVEEEVEELINSVRYISEDYNINIDSDIPTNLYTPAMHQTELYSILVNLVTNSIKAVIADSDGEGRIHIDGMKEDDSVVLRVHDTGVGLPTEHRDEILQPLVSDPEDNLYDDLEKKMPTELSSQLGSGSGLGLSIVEDIANKHGGSLGFIDTDDWTTTAEVILHDE